MLVAELEALTVRKDAEVSFVAIKHAVLEGFILKKGAVVSVLSLTCDQDAPYTAGVERPLPVKEVTLGIQLNDMVTMVIGTIKAPKIIENFDIYKITYNK
jgi:hypothetical protein